MWAKGKGRSPSDTYKGVQKRAQGTDGLLIYAIYVQDSGPLLRDTNLSVFLSREDVRCEGFADTCSADVTPMLCFVCAVQALDISKPWGRNLVVLCCGGGSEFHSWEVFQVAGSDFVFRTDVLPCFLMHVS